jgi:polyhydroxybutyrate depolymerase
MEPALTLKRMFLLLCLTLLFHPGTGAATEPSGPDKIIIETRGGVRDAYLVAAGRKGPQPTVIVLHGRFMSATRTIHKYGFAGAANRHGFNAVFADGIKRRWQDGRIPRRHPIDDVGFIRALVGHLVASHIADPRRLYLVGISNGGMMSYTLACRAGGLFAGVATVIATMPSVDHGCALKPMPLVMFNGSADPLVPYNGGTVARIPMQGEVLGADRTAQKFARANGCGAYVTTALHDSNPGDGVSVIRRDWTGCRPGFPVIAYEVLGGGHAVSGKNSLPVHLFGKASPDIDSAELIMDFFDRLR